MEKNKLQIICPECGHQFSPEKALEGHLKQHFEKEYADKLAVKVKEAADRAMISTREEFKAKLEALQTEAQQKAQKLKELEGKSVALAQKERELSEREERAELELKKKLLVAEEKIYGEAEKRAREKAEVEYQEREAFLKRQQESIELAIRKSTMEQVEKIREEERLKQAELQMKLDAQVRMAEEMRRKAEQGSMQLQGEVQEIAIEEYLQNAYPKDEIVEINKGTRGADCIHVVKDNFGNACGRILYESKRTKSFSKDWIKKHKEDMRLKQAGFGVIVTEAMPPELSRFGWIDGVWVCSYAEFKSVSLLLRLTVIKVGEVIAAQENKGDKMQLLYDYLTGDEFRQKIEAIVEAFSQMHADLQRERTQTMANWAKREKQILKVMENTVSLYGDVKGIAGGAVQSIKSLEEDGDVNLLREAS